VKGAEIDDLEVYDEDDDDMEEGIIDSSPPAQPSLAPSAQPSGKFNTHSSISHSEITSVVLIF
jgi:hypothetical protein